MMTVIIVLDCDANDDFDDYCISISEYHDDHDHDDQNSFDECGNHDDCDHCS